MHSRTGPPRWPGSEQEGHRPRHVDGNPPGLISTCETAAGVAYSTVASVQPCFLGHPARPEPRSFAGIRLITRSSGWPCPHSERWSPSRCSCWLTQRSSVISALHSWPGSGSQRRFSAPWSTSRYSWPTALPPRLLGCSAPAICVGRCGRASTAAGSHSWSVQPHSSLAGRLRLGWCRCSGRRPTWPLMRRPICGSACSEFRRCCSFSLAPACYVGCRTLGLRWWSRSPVPSGTSSSTCCWCTGSASASPARPSAPSSRSPRWPRLSLGWSYSVHAGIVLRCDRTGPVSGDRSAPACHS